MPNRKSLSPLSTYNTEENPLVPFIVIDLNNGEPRPICVIAAQDSSQAKALFENENMSSVFDLSDDICIRLPFLRETLMKIGNKTLAEHTSTVKIAQRIIDFT